MFDTKDTFYYILTDEGGSPRYFASNNDKNVGGRVEITAEQYADAYAMLTAEQRRANARWRRNVKAQERAGGPNRG
jgi:stress response protein SCP2